MEKNSVYKQQTLCRVFIAFEDDNSFSRVSPVTLVKSVRVRQLDVAVDELQS